MRIMHKKLVYRDEVDTPIVLPDFNNPTHTSQFFLSLPDVSARCPSAKAQLNESMGISFHPVSYTPLDVYKRQMHRLSSRGRGRRIPVRWHGG